jgi:uncharacterized protein (UPF0333 family)
MRVKRGQAALEYMMIAGLVSIIIIPAIYLLYAYTQSSVDELDHDQLNRLGRDVIAAAEQVYYLGPPSRVLIETRMPSLVKNMSVWKTNNGFNILTFNLSGGQGVEITETGGEKNILGIDSFLFTSSVNINGSFSAAFENRSVSKGIKSISIEAYEMKPHETTGVVTAFSYVNMGGRCPRSVTYDFNRDGAVDGVDRAFYDECFCDGVDRPQSRPIRTWQSGWFDNAGALGGNPYAVCMNLDYDADCDVDADDLAPACTALGAGSPFCDPPPVCP